MNAKGPTCPVVLTTSQLENRGLVWVIGAFVICPCHLPITLWVAVTLLSGTAAGALLRGHPYIAGAIITLAWMAATWHGIRYLQRARRYARATRPESSQ